VYSGIQYCVERRQRERDREMIEKMADNGENWMC